jgi:hypothetical protein
MFSIANKIAYGEQMVKKLDKQKFIETFIGMSTWF